MENPELTKQRTEVEEKPVYVDTSLIINMKASAKSLMEALETLRKKQKLKKTKYSRKVMKALDEFVRCHLNSPAISKKYFAVKSILEEHYKQYEAKNADQG